MPRSSILGRPATAGLPSFFVLVAVTLATFGVTDSRAVVGGTVASSADWPFVVGLQVPSGRCAASVISATAVLTAAHCAIDPQTARPFDPAAITVLGQDGAHLASDVRIPPSYTIAALRGDLSVVFLATPMSAPPVALQAASDPDLSRTGTVVRLAGFGTENILKEAPFTILKDDACRDSAPSQGIPFDGDSMFCLAGVLDGAHQCLGDSGGPVVSPVVPGSTALVDQRLIGVVSWGATNCSGINVEADATFLSSWIVAQLATPPLPVSGPDLGSQPVAHPSRLTRVKMTVAAARQSPRRWIFTVGARHGSDRGEATVELQHVTARGYRTFLRIPIRLGSGTKVIWTGSFPRPRRIRALLPATTRWARSTSPVITVNPTRGATAGRN